MTAPKPDPVVEQIEALMHARGVPADQWDTVRRMLILTFHREPFELPEGPGIAADLLLASSALDGEPAPGPGLAAVRDGTRDFLVQHNVLEESE